MTKYVIRRVVQAIPVLFGITIVVYAILLAAPGGPDRAVRQQPPGDARGQASSSRRPGAWTSRSPSSTAAGSAPATRTSRDGARDLPAAGRVPRPDAAGRTSSRRRSAAPRTASSTATSASRSTAASRWPTRIARAALPTLILASIAFVIWITLAIVIGVYAAVRRYSLFDQAATIFAYVGFAMPTFWLGIMLIYIFSGPGLNILPAGGITTTRLSPPFGSDAYWVYFGAAARWPRSPTSPST